jgi:type IV pilus assembly protein PilW
MTRTFSDRPQGFTLIELMVAMVLGLLVAAGIVTVFASTSNSNKAQTQLARLQEEGRFAMTRIGTDLRMANGQYCTNSGGVAKAGSGGTFLDHLRAPKVYATGLIGAAGAVSGALGDVTTAWGTTSGTAVYPAAPTAPYSMPSFLYTRGYDCGLTTCTPTDPTAAGLPAMGPGFGNRVVGADVLTVRYLNPSSGWEIGAVGGSTIAAASSAGAVTSITITKVGNEPPRTHFKNGDLAMLADCSNAQIFAANYSASTGVLTPSVAANFTGTGPVAQQPESAPMVFDVNRDIQTVSYYLKVVSANNDGNAPFTGALMRRVNGGDTTKNNGSDDELVRGVERLDFRYGVQDSSGNTSFLSADDVDKSTACPPAELDAITKSGCLWRGIKSIEVSVLMDGQIPLYMLANDDLFYRYSADANSGLLAPSGHAIKPSAQGFPDQMLRREFNTLIAVRNYNP